MVKVYNIYINDKVCASDGYLTLCLSLGTSTLLTLTSRSCHSSWPKSRRLKVVGIRVSQCLRRSGKVVPISLLTIWLEAQKPFFWRAHLAVAELRLLLWDECLLVPGTLLRCVNQQLCLTSLVQAHEPKGRCVDRLADLDRKRYLGQLGVMGLRNPRWEWVDKQVHSQ